MTLLNNILPFESALQGLRRRKALPTNLSSAELSQLGPAFHQWNLVSARTPLADYMDEVKARVENLLDPKTERRADRVTPENPEGFVTTGLDPATVRAGLKDFLKSISYAPAPDEAGTIKDLSSDKRLNLLIKTNAELAQGYGNHIQANSDGALAAFPCQELYRLEARKDERDWPHRWRIATQVAGDVDAARVLEETGRMMARKDSGIWPALGEGAGGYQDTLGNSFPPFAFNSGMWVRDIARDEALELGLIDEEDRVAPTPVDFQNPFEVAA